MRYNSFIKEHRDVTMSGTKRFTDKSGEYYLQNLDKFQKNNLNVNQKSITSLKLNIKNNNDNNDLNSKKHIIKVKKKKLLDDLIPIPMKQKNKLKNEVEKKNLLNAVSNAKYLRRYQYSNNITQKQIQQYKEMQKNEKIFFNKIKFIQIWWKTIFQIIKIQKYIRGYLYRTKLISILDQKEKYVDKVIHIVKTIKKIFLYRFLNKLILCKPDKKYYFYKWRDFAHKKNILKELIKYMKEYNENNNSYLIYKKANKIFNRDIIDSENEFYKIKNEHFEEDDFLDKSLLGLYNNSVKNRKVKKGKHLSSSSFALRTKKKILNIGLELSSSQIINRVKKNIYDNNQTNYNKRSRVRINQKMTQGFENNNKRFHNRNKSNNQQNFNKNKKIKNNTNINQNIKERCLKEKSFNDLKSLQNNFKNRFNDSKKNIAFYKNETILTKSSNIDITKNTRISTNDNTKEDNSKKNLNYKKMIHSYEVPSVSSHSSTLFNNIKNKKIRVYENKLSDYNKKLCSENNNENQLLPINKNNHLNDKFQPYVESIYDESQFSAFLDNSTLINNKIIYNNDNDNEKSINKIKTNICIDEPSIFSQEIIEYNENLIILKKYFSLWAKKTIFGLFLKNIYFTKKFQFIENILKTIFLDKFNKYFMSKFRNFYSFIIMQKIVDFFDNLKLRIFLQKIKLFNKKYILLKYFKFYKSVIDKKIILKNILEYDIYIIKKNKGKKRKIKEKLLNSNDLENEESISYNPINDLNNNFINNRYNLNNNSNNCVIINNLNYNNNNTNKVNIDFNYEKDSKKNNENQNYNNSIGIIRSKIIEFPKNLCMPKQSKQYIAVYDNNIIFDYNPNSHKTIDNSYLYNYNINNNIENQNQNNIPNKITFSFQENLSKSVNLPNKAFVDLKPDLTTQKNQLIMVINIIERHRKSEKYNLFLSCFQRWKNHLNYIIPNINDNNSNIKLRNKKNIKKNKNLCINNKNEKIINFSGGTTDNEELTKNTINSEGFPTESDSKSENKISTKSLRIISNKLNTKLSSDQQKYYSSSTIDLQENKNKNDEIINKSAKGVYKKKTILGSSHLNSSLIKKNNINNSIYISPNHINQNMFQVNKYPIDNIPNEFNIRDSINEYDNGYILKSVSDKNLNLSLRNNIIDTNISNSINMNNLRYSSPEEFFGFKKVNKIEEMEVSFVPLNEKKIVVNNIDMNININKNRYPNSINNINNNEKNELEKKDVIIEAIEEYNEYEGDNENYIQKIKNDFNDYEEKVLNKTFNCFKINLYIDLIDEEKDIKNKSMINIT